MSGGAQEEAEGSPRQRRGSAGGIGGVSILLRDSPVMVPTLAVVALFVAWATDQGGYPVTHWAPGGLVVLATRAAWIDPALSLLVSAIIVVGVVRIVREACDVLLESAPDHAQVPLVRRSIRALPAVVDVHDLHVWTIGPGSHALSAHVLLQDARISEASAVLRSIEGCLREEFAITHVTIQFECENCSQDERIICTQARPAR